MNIFFSFHEAEIKDRFPSELGYITSQSMSNSEIKNFYFLDGTEIFNNKSKEGSIRNIKFLNFFIGTNNSGKSRFLRSLFRIGHFYIAEKNESPNYLLGIVQSNQLINHKISLANNIGVDVQNFWKNLSFHNPFSIKDIKKKTQELQRVKENYDKLYRDSKTTGFDTQGLKISLETIDEIFSFIESLNFHNFHKLSSVLYIPTLRTIVSDMNLQTDAFSKVINNKFKLTDNVFTGQDIYQRIYKLHNSIKITELKAFCQWIKNNFYKEHSVEIIPNDDTRDVYLQIDDTHRPIYDLGDGIQQLILLMFPIYTSTLNTWFFIEEPETHLHPGLQRIFIETLLNDEYLKNKNLKFFFTTHSNHFLDLSIDRDEISIFQFEKENAEKFNIKTNVKPSKEILDLLGVNSSSVFLANASIWVEGPTDRRYLSKWLKLYCEHHNFPYLREDIDFAFFEYGGNLIEHYLFDDEFDEDVTENQVREKIKAFSHSNKIYLLADNDNADNDSAKGKRRKKLEDISNKYFHYQNTEYREIENLLSAKIIKDFLPELASTLIESISTVNFAHEDYYKVGLGEFIEDLFRKGKIKGKKFKAKSGTLNNLYKNKLCDFVVNSSYAYSDLIDDNQHLDKLIADLYNFIKSK